MQNQLNSLMDFTFVSRYAQYDPKLQRRKTWQEACNSVKDLHYKNYQDIPEIFPHIDRAVQSQIEKEVLGSQRILQFAGDAVLKHNARAYNCAGLYFDKPESFAWGWYLLLCGTGVGGSVQTHHVQTLPNLYEAIPNTAKIYVIDDSIEGWADCMYVLWAAYSGYLPVGREEEFRPYLNSRISFDFSKIRLKGAPFSHGIGVAPGPDGLRQSLERIVNIFEKSITSGVTQLRSIDVYDIFMHQADAVLSGGIRRSATIILFSSDDELMMNAKTGSWFVENPQRGRSNNSAVLIRGKTSQEEFNRLFDSTKQFGEPGFFWVDDRDIITNPCFPDNTWVMTSGGARQIKDLIGQSFVALVNGKPYQSTNRGFFETGIKEIFEIETHEGFKVSATKDHKFLTRNNEWKSLQDLSTDEEIVIHNHESDQIWQGSGGTFGQGWLVGNLTGDGFISAKTGSLDHWGESRHHMQKITLKYLKQHQYSGDFVTGTNQSAKVGKTRVSSAKFKTYCEQFNLIHNNKTLNAELEKTSHDFYRGFLRGYFDADGSVQGNLNKGRSVRLSSINLDNLELVQRMLLRLGIYSKIFKNRAPAGLRDIGGTKYFCQTTHELIISKDMISKFAEIVGFHDPHKDAKIKQMLRNGVRTLYKTNFYATISNIQSAGTKKVYDCTIEEVHAFDANGFYVHNCCEIQFFCYDTTQSNWSRTPKFSGVQMCNLSTINGSKIKTKQEFYNSVENATILGTLQAGYDTFPYLGKTSENIIRREALLGVSITGMMESEDILFNPEVLREGAKIAKQINRKIAKILGINSAARICCIKPEGTTSTILGTCAGIHPSHARSYIRGVQCNKLDPITNYYIQHNPSCVEESCWSASKVDYFVKFYCEVPKTTILKKQLTALAMLDKIKLVQQNWVVEGRNPELCTGNANMTHNVSNTVTVLNDEWNYVRDYIFENQTFFSGISLLGNSGDKDFRQAPFVEVKSGEEILTTYGNSAMFTSGLIEDAQSAYGDLWSACSSILGFSEIVEVSHLKDKIATEEGSEKWTNSGLHKTSTTSCLEKYLETTTTNWYFKNQWCQRLRKFAKNHKIDIKTCCDMLKDVYILNDAMKITRNHKKVDFSQCVEHSNNTAGTQEIACAGGACIV